MPWVQLQAWPWGKRSSLRSWQGHGPPDEPTGWGREGSPWVGGPELRHSKLQEGRGAARAGTRCGLCSDQRPGLQMDTPAGQSEKRHRTFWRTPGEGRQSTGPQSPEAERRSQSAGSGDHGREGGALGGRGNWKERLKKEDVGQRRAKIRERRAVDTQRTTQTRRQRPADGETQKQRDRGLCGGRRERGSAEAATERGKRVWNEERKRAGRPRSRRGGAAGEGAEALCGRFFKSPPNPFSCCSQAAALRAEGSSLRGKWEACRGQFITR